MSKSVCSAAFRLANCAIRKPTLLRHSLKSHAPVLSACRVLNNSFAMRSSPQSRLFSSTSDAFDENDEYFGDEDFVQYPESTAKINQLAPSFSGQALVDGEFVDLKMEEYRGKYVVLFFYPKDFTFVCPTEIIAFSDRIKEFEDINTKVIACSTDTVNCHLAWTRMPRNAGGLGKMNIPIIGDVNKVIASKYGVLDESAGICFRGLYIIDPKGVLQQATFNNLNVGRSVDETLRLLNAFQFTEKHGVVCPANWTPGDKTMIANPEDSLEYFGSVADNDDASTSTKLVSVKSKTDFEKLVASGKPVVADFMASYCEKCKQIEPYVNTLAEENDDITFVKLDTTISELDELKKSLDIVAIPAFRFFKDGKEVGEPVTGYKKRLLAAQVKNLA